MSALVEKLKKQGYTFIKSEQGGGITIFAKKRSTLAGTLDIEITGGSVYISNIYVAKTSRNKRLGTALYELAAGVACERNYPLTSDWIRSHFAESFWRKQQQKGLAVCIPNHAATPNVFSIPLHHFMLTAGRKCRKQKQPIRNCIMQALEKLPKPDQDAWPCLRYTLKRDACGKTLEGLRRNGRRK